MTSARPCLLVGTVALATLLGAHAAAAEILVGFAGPLTGEMDLAGEQMEHGTELAVAELNAEGGVLGQKVQLDIVDDHCDGEQALAAARKLVVDGVVAAIGHLCSNTAIAASEVYEAAGIPFITIGANPLVTGRGLRFTFRGGIADDASAPFSAQYMVRQLAAKRIAIVHDTRVYGKGLAELTRQGVEELGMSPVLFEAVQPEQLLFTDLIERLRRADADVLYYGGYPREVGLLRRQMAEAGFLPTMITAGTNTNEEYLLIAGPAAEGTLVVADRQLNTAEFSRFEAKFRATYGVESDLRVARGYSSAMLWAQAVAAAGTTNGTAVARALHSQTFHVFGIEARFDDQGNVLGPLGETALWVWHDGKPVPLPSESPAESQLKP